MIVRFGISNFRSLRDWQELSLAASKLSDWDEGLITSKAVVVPVLPLAVIYGANASGKSNFVSAIRFVRDMIVESHVRLPHGGGVPRRAFALDADYAKRPTVAEIDFVSEGTLYTYGFSATDEAFTEEHLYAYPFGKRQVLFARKNQVFNFGRTLKGENKTIEKLARPNSLFLSVAAQNNHKELSPLVQYFENVTVRDDSRGHEFVTSRSLHPRVLGILRDVGTGVVAFREQPIKLSEETRSALEALLSSFGGGESVKLDDDPPMKIIEFAHMRRDGELVHFEPEVESAGTRRLMVLLAPILRAIDEGYPLVIDELDASLHTKLCEKLVSLFASRSQNPKRAQLITTTHDTNLINSRLLRRDQIWFAEKDVSGATAIYSLAEFKTRQGDRFEKGYLEGRFGAVPPNWWEYDRGEE